MQHQRVSSLTQCGRSLSMLTLETEAMEQRIVLGTLVISLLAVVALDCSKENSIQQNTTNNYSQAVVCEGPVAANTMCEAAQNAPKDAYCVYGYCRKPCTSDADCEVLVPGSICLPGADGSGCRLPQEAACGSGQPDCPGGLECVKGECRAQCTDGECVLQGLSCETGACVGTATGVIPEAGIDGQKDSSGESGPCLAYLETCIQTEECCSPMQCRSGAGGLKCRAPNDAAAESGPEPAVEAGPDGCSPTVVPIVPDVDAGVCNAPIPTPEAGVADPNGFEVSITAGDGAGPTVVPRVIDKSQCGANDGWYFDNNLSPASIELCSKTCSGFAADPAATVWLSLGCLAGQSHHPTWVPWGHLTRLCSREAL